MEATKVAHLHCLHITLSNFFKVLENVHILILFVFPFSSLKIKC